MNILIIHDPQNTWLGTLKRFKRDGDEFKRQAENCAQYYFSQGHGITSLKIQGKNALQKRRRLFTDLISMQLNGKRFDRIIFLCHGHPKALNRGMITIDNIDTFSAHLKSLLVDNLAAIIFFCCKTAKLETCGFSEHVAQKTDVDVIGHTTSGHTTKNPYKRWVANHYPYAQNCYPSNKKEFKKHVKKMWSSETAAFEFVEGQL